jgi:hypothetical protein
MKRLRRGERPKDAYQQSAHAVFKLLDAHKKRLARAMTVRCARELANRKSVMFRNLILVDAWVKRVENGGLVNANGYGWFAFQRPDGAWMATPAEVHPSDVTVFRVLVPEWATHVLWFSR